MNPFDLIPWAVAIGVSMLILALPTFVISAAISAGRQA